MTERAKVFKHGRSRAIRLPAQYRFDADEVLIRRDPLTGDVVLSDRPSSWKEFFKLRSAAEVPKDFLTDRADTTPQKRKLF